MKAFELIEKLTNLNPDAYVYIGYESDLCSRAADSVSTDAYGDVVISDDYSDR